MPFITKYSCKIKYSNSSEFKGKLEIGNDSATEFDSKFINIAELLTKSYKNIWVESDFAKSSAILINLEITSLPLNSEELLYLTKF
jgi:hypothetical protein